MEKGLNSRNSLTKIQKSYKKTHAAKSSLDETVLKHFDGCNTPSSINIRSSLQASLMRNTFNNFKSPVKSQESGMSKLKSKKTTKKPNLK